MPARARTTARRARGARVAVARRTTLPPPRHLASSVAPRAPLLAMLCMLPLDASDAACLHLLRASAANLLRVWPARRCSVGQRCHHCSPCSAPLSLKKKLAGGEGQPCNACSTFDFSSSNISFSQLQNFEHEMLNPDKKNVEWTLLKY